MNEKINWNTPFDINGGIVINGVTSHGSYVVKKDNEFTHGTFFPHVSGWPKPDENFTFENVEEAVKWCEDHHERKAAWAEQRRRLLASPPSDQDITA